MGNKHVVTFNLILSFSWSEKKYHLTTTSPCCNICKTKSPGARWAPTSRPPGPPDLPNPDLRIHQTPHPAPPTPEPCQSPRRPPRQSLLHFPISKCNCNAKTTCSMPAQHFYFRRCRHMHLILHLNSQIAFNENYLQIQMIVTIWNGPEHGR